MDCLLFVIKKEFHIVHEAKNRGSEFNVQEVVFRHDHFSSRHRVNRGNELRPRLGLCSPVRERLDMACPGRLTGGHAVWGSGAGRFRWSRHLWSNQNTGRTETYDRTAKRS
jgi:hypothetical protein